MGSLFGTLGNRRGLGFIVAVLTTFLWPWIVPEPLDNWMDGRIDTSLPLLRIDHG